MNTINRIFILLSIFCIAGCMSYVDPSIKNLDESQYAIINVDISIKIEEIDGERLSLNWLSPFDELKMSPGEHTFKIIWDNINIRTEPITMTVKLEAGETYQLSRITDPKTQTWGFKFIRQQ